MAHLESFAKEPLDMSLSWLLLISSSSSVDSDPNVEGLIFSRELKLKFNERNEKSGMKTALEISLIILCDASIV